MKKSPNSIDLLFQSHFDDHEVTVTNPDRLWRKIITNGKRRSRGILLFFTIFLLLTSWWAYSQLHNNPETGSDEDFTKKVNISPIAANNPASSFTTSTKNKNNLTTSNNAIGGIGASALAEQRPSLRINDSQVNNSQKLQSTEQEPANNIFQDGRTQNNTAGFQNPNSIFLTESNLLNNNKGDTEDIVIAPAEPKQSNLTSVRQQSEITSIETISLTPLFSNPSLLAPPLKNGMMERCEVGKNNFKPYVDVYGLVAAPIESVSLSSSATDQSQLLTYWEERFNPLTSIAAGIALGNEWANGIGASVGIEYQRMESQYKSTQTITETTTIYDPMAFFFIDVDDQVVWVGDSVTSVTTYDRTVAHANTTTLVNLPIHLSYNIVNQGPWAVRATAGGILNLSLQYRGRYLQSDQSLIIISDANDANIVTPRIGISAEAGLDIGYILGSNWEVYASPRYRYNGSSIWQANEAISLSRDFLSLRTGIRYHF